MNEIFSSNLMSKIGKSPICVEHSMNESKIVPYIMNATLKNLHNTKTKKV